MKTVVQNENYGEFVVDENVWTGKIKVFPNGKELAKVDKTRYLIEEKKYIDFTGNSIKGLYMTVDNQTTQVTAPAKWYEIALSVLIFVVILIWGNSLTLCSIVPVVGGAIGGGLSAMLAVVNLFVMRGIKNVALKLLAFVGIFAVTFGLCAAIGTAILAAIV